jgi:hypothetical protein
MNDRKIILWHMAFDLYMNYEPEEAADRLFELAEKDITMAEAYSEIGQYLTSIDEEYSARTVSILTKKYLGPNGH